MNALTPPPFSCTVSPNGGRPTLAVCGELDLATVPDVEHELYLLRDEGAERLLLDLRGVTFADSTAVSLVVRWSRVARAASWELRVALAPDIQEVFELAGVMGTLDLVDQ